MSVKKKRALIILISIVVILVLLFSAILIIANKTKNIVLFTINGYEVVEEEYIWAMNRCRNKVLEKFQPRGEEPLDWMGETPNGIPHEVLSDMAVAFLVELHASYDVAKDDGILEDVGYKSLKDRFEAENKKRAEDKAAGKVVYGLSQYNFDQYVSYELDSFLEQYCDNQDKAGNSVAESELLSLYNETKDNLYILEDDVDLSYIKVDYVVNKFSEDELEDLREQVKQLSIAVSKQGSIEKELENFPALKEFHEKQSVLGDEIVQYSRIMGDVLELASTVEEGETSDVVEQNGRIFLIECVRRVDNDYIPFNTLTALLQNTVHENRYKQLIQSRVKESVVVYKLKNLYSYTMKKL